MKEYFILNEENNNNDIQNRCRHYRYTIFACIFLIQNQYLYPLFR